MNDGYQSFLTKEQLMYNITYQIERNPQGSLGDIIKRVLTASEYEKSSD